MGSDGYPFFSQVCVEKETIPNSLLYLNKVNVQPLNVRADYTKTLQDSVNLFANSLRHKFVYDDGGDSNC